MYTTNSSLDGAYIATIELFLCHSPMSLTKSFLLDFDGKSFMLAHILYKLLHEEKIWCSLQCRTTYHTLCLMPYDVLNLYILQQSKSYELHENAYYKLK